MNIKINRNNIIEHNRHILAVSGGDFGILNNSNLEFAIDSVNNEKKPINQATNFLYYGTINHPFLNGNKRTAFEVAKGIMASGAIVVDASPDEVVSFVTGSLAQGKASKEDVRSWLTFHSKPLNQAPTPEFNEITKKNIDKDKKLLKKLD